VTVLVRPVPKRAGSNGIRPFVRPPVNNIRPYTVKNWRPPVPEPLPPAPLLGPKELLGLGLLVLAQIWGLLNKKRTLLLKPSLTGEFTEYGDYGGQANQYMVNSDRIYCGNGLVKEKGWTNNTMGSLGVGKSYGVRYELFNVDAAIVCSASDVKTPSTTVPWAITYKRTTAGGPWVEAFRWTTSKGETVGSLGWRQTMTTRPFVVGLTRDGAPLIIPSEGEVPARDAVPESVPQLPPLITPVKPAAPPAVEPETQPEIAPVEPGPVRPPTTTPALPPARLPVRPADTTGIKDGAIVPKPADPVVVTDPDWHFPIPGKGPIVGNGPRPTPEEMAKELGRLEQKLNSILNPTPDTPMEWQEWLKQIADALLNLVGGTTYTLTEDCNPDGDPNYQPRSWDFQAAGALNAFGVLENRIDALAAMIDQSLRAKQQVCLPTGQEPAGVSYSVQFRSVVVSPNGEKRLRKELRYRDQGDAGLVAHRDHWLGFEWTSGPWMVKSTGLRWGKPQVWASSPEEGKRVLAHAATISGVNLQDPKHQWFVRLVQNARYGPQLRMVVHRDTRGVPWITTRDGSNGLPLAAP
jgi:hypothetical protein